MNNDRDNEVIEILCNSQCGRHCIGCNQSPFMKRCPDYEYTVKNADELIKCLESVNQKRRLCFTGGEPILWKSRDKVSKIFRESEYITEMWIVTSVPDEHNITELKEQFGKVCLSMRNSTAKFIESSPAHLKDVIIWDQRIHAIPFTTNPTESVECCCAMQGIRASMIGDKIYPCVIAQSLSIDTGIKWYESLSVMEYLTKGFKKQIGEYEACHYCLNNLEYRRNCKQGLT